MRIIAGKYKSRQIKQPKGKQTRPTADKIKEAVFHKMGPFFNGGLGLDLFAGSGNLGIEAMSRGFEQMIFIDNSNQAIQAIRENCKMLEQNTYEIYKNDSLRALHILAKKNRKFDGIFIDPPYDSQIYKSIIDKIFEFDLLIAGGLLYIEHQHELTINLPDDYTLIFNKRYSESIAVKVIQKQ